MMVLRVVLRLVLRVVLMLINTGNPRLLLLLRVALFTLLPLLILVLRMRVMMEVIDDGAQ